MKDLLLEAMAVSVGVGMDSPGNRTAWKWRKGDL